MNVPGRAGEEGHGRPHGDEPTLADALLLERDREQAVLSAVIGELRSGRPVTQFLDQRVLFTLNPSRRLVRHKNNFLAVVQRLSGAR